MWLHRVVTQPGLARRLGTFDAVIIGLGSMLGAGVFAAFSPAAGVAGAGLLIGLAVAALVAYCNATASAQLAAEYPTSGGTYIYGRERLGPWWGFFAGWGFVIGKTASCAAMALTFAAYVSPPAWERPVAVAAVIILATVNYYGITRTAALTKIIVAIVLATLALVVTASLSSTNATASVRSWDLLASGWYGLLQSAGLLFFAFAGYARIATMGEEVRDPERVIPRAILTALTIAVSIYLLVGASILVALGPAGVAASPAPLAAAVNVAGWGWAGLPVRLGAAAAALGALLALIAGVGRTTLAMARHDDLPRWLAAVHERHQVPHHGEVTVAGLVCLDLGHGSARRNRLLLVRGPAVLPDRQPGRIHAILRPAPISPHPADHRDGGMRDFSTDIAIERCARWNLSLRARDPLSSRPGASPPPGPVLNR